MPPSVSRLSKQCGIVNILQPYRPPRSVVGRASLDFLLYTLQVRTHVHAACPARVVCFDLQRCALGKLPVTHFTRASCYS
jgi:hypothetical protein